MLPSSNRNRSVAFYVLGAVIGASAILVGCSQLKPAESLHVERLTVEQFKRIVAEEVPIGSSPGDVRLWLEHRQLPIHSWTGDSLDEATSIEYLLPEPNLDSKCLYFEFDKNGSLTRFGIFGAVP